MTEADNLQAWDGKPGYYEAWFLTFSDGTTGHWIRYTISAPKGAPAEARLWFAQFDRDRPGSALALNRGVPISEYSASPGAFEVKIGEAILRSGHAEGAISGGGNDVAWDLDFETGDPTYRLLPDALYRGGLAPTKPYSPNPDTRFGGTITVDGETIPVDGVPGQQGHVYGARHAERWVWANCASFEDGEGAAVQAVVAQGKRGLVTTPYVTFVGVRWQGRWQRCARASRRRDSSLGAWRIDVDDRRYRLSGRVAADPSFMVRARYLDPDGSERFCHNSEVASSRFVLFERGRGGFEEVAVLRSEGTTHAEWGGRTPAPVEMPEHQPVEGDSSG